MWLDEIQLTVVSGKGGDGMSSFRREKGVEWGGPNGGDGGRGGDVVVVGARNVRSLIALRGKRRLAAGKGENGGSSGKTGKSGRECRLRLPLGTLIRRADGGRVIADLTRDGEEHIVVTGGRGGRGNGAFATPTNRAPQYRELGENGGEVALVIELKLIADVGLVGLPNAGKSTLLSRLSAARPKIADYPFTTLDPNLGVVEESGAFFTMADLPGLIRGAHEGKGLGFRFLKHVERTRMIVHLVDATSENPIDDYEAIREELEAYGHGLAEKPSVVVFTKLDAVPDFRAPIEEAMTISAQSGAGLPELCREVARRLSEIAVPEALLPEIISEDDEVPPTVTREDDAFVVAGTVIEEYLARRPPADMYGWRRFWSMLDRWGIADELKRQGIEEGDTVRIGKLELEYLP